MEENTFASHIIAATLFGFPVDTFDLRCIVKLYADRKGIKIIQFKKNLHGKNGLRHSWNVAKIWQYDLQIGPSIKRKRAEVGPSVVDKYFENLSKKLKEVESGKFGTTMRETNLTDEQGQKKVVTKHGCKYPERVNGPNTTKSSTSLMFFGNANAEGELLPPYVVY